MATNFMKYDAVHGEAEATMMLATLGGAHILNFVDTVNDTDNGTIVGVGEHMGDDFYAVTNPTTLTGVVEEISTTGKAVIAVKTAENAFLICTDPQTYVEYNSKVKEPCYFYNGKGEKMTGLEIKVYDRFAVSAPAIEGVIAKGAEVTLTGKKLTIA